LFQTTASKKIVFRDALEFSNKEVNLPGENAGKCKVKRVFIIFKKKK